MAPSAITTTARRKASFSEGPRSTAQSDDATHRAERRAHHSLEGEATRPTERISLQIRRIKQRGTLSSPGLTGRSSIPETVVLMREVSGMLDAPLSRSMTAGDMGRRRTCAHVLATGFVRALPIHRPRNQGRAQGMPGGSASPMAPVQQVSTGQEPQVQPKSPAFPARWC